MRHSRRFKFSALAIAVAFLFSVAPPVGATSSPTYQNPIYFKQGGTAIVVKRAAGSGFESDNGSIVYNQRFRTTIANVNTGVTLLAAIPGYKYRVIDATMISVGGAVGTCTSVDVLGTQSTSQKLLAVAIAALTQSAVVRAGAANAVVLADGASFVKNDVNTAITIGKTGGTCDTATNVDLILTYAIEL